ncbi:type II toxin-antitoxin system prevent-host-death family antitoxin [Solimonas sp. K1W22B-7]|uniref:type II toxin-antitoxin system prevent-host-death family antitoxin n=1 Tax=Solimonas sp. K1W22B-7 TaxID=2303331 RepID=UPI0013C4F508|nr:type II toxin-antitoxin system prevent-host-death family antitoxin [Solimonas sp. K1W22B-7]
MESFTIRDLRERTGDLVRGAESGKLSLVTKRGQPLFVAVPFDDALLQGGVRRSFVLRLVGEGIVSQGKGAELLGISRAEFLDVMAAHGIPAANYAVEDFHQELEDLGAG